MTMHPEWHTDSKREQPVDDSIVIDGVIYVPIPLGKLAMAGFRAGNTRVHDRFTTQDYQDALYHIRLALD